MAKRKTRAARKQQLAAKLPLTRDYQPIMVHHWGIRPRDLPLFTFLSVQAMLYDPTIRLGLAMRAAPVYQTQFGYDKDGQWTPGVEAKNEAVGEFVYRQLQRIWHHECHAIVKAQLWGHAAGEVLLRLTEDNLVEVDRLLERHPNDVRALKRAGQNVGIRISRLTRGTRGNLDLEWPKGYWTTFNAEPGTFYGTSILLGAYSPWYDKWCDGGALDVRRLYMHKDAYVGASIYYPEGDLYTMPDGSEVPARDLARQMIEQIVAGGVVALPSDLDEKGNRKWELKPATVASNPAHILKYPQDLDTEMLRGLEVPDDIFTADSTSSGAWAGKKVPLSAFYAGIDCWVVQIIKDLCRCIFEPLVLLNFGKAEEFQITHKPLGQQAMEQQNQPQGGQQPGQQQPGAAGMGGLFGGGGDEGGGEQPGADQGGGGQQSLADLLGSPAAQQARQGGGPQAMSLEAAIGKGVIDAAKIVQASREQVDAAMLRMAAATPREGDRNAEGLIFHDSRWHREEELRGAGGTTPAPAVTNESHVAAYQQGDNRAAANLLKQNAGLIYNMAKKFAKHYDELDDLQQEARIAVLHAAKAFDPSKGFQFSTLATRSIINRLSNVTGRTRKRKGVWQQTPEDEEGNRPEPSVKPDRLPTEEREQQASVLKAVEALPEKSREIVKRRYGLDGEPPESASDIGRRIGVSPQRVSKILDGAREHLRSALQDYSIQLAIRMAADANPWQPYKGPRGGTGWVHSGTQDVRYVKERPGAHETGGSEKAGTPSSPAAESKSDRPPVSTSPPALIPDKSELDSWEGDRWKVAMNALVRAKQKGGTIHQSRDEAGNLNGIALTVPEERYVVVDMLATKERGNGRKMMATICDQAAKAGKGISLLAARSAVGFYEKLGMHRSGFDFWFTAAEAAAFVGMASEALGATKMSLDDAAEFEPEDGVFVDNQTDEERAIERPVRMAGEVNPWMSYKGKHGGQGWVRSDTKEVRYQKDRPGVHEGAPGAPAGQQATAAKPPQTPQELNQALDAVAANPQQHGLDQATAAKLQQAGTPQEKIAVLDEATGHKFDKGGTPATKPAAAPAQPSTQPPQPAAPQKPAAPQPAKPSPEAEKYLTAANANLQKISRTAQGKVDVSASKEKAGKMQVSSGDEAANLAKTNFARTMTGLHEQRGRKFSSPQEAVDFADSVNKSINQGITKSGVLLRTDDSEKYPYTDVAKLHKAREQFGKEFAQRLDNSDPREMAAWVHWRLNMTDHPYADGVGKTSEALANWVLMRAGQPLPQIDSRQNWFANANKQKADPDNPSSYYHKGYSNWVRYYKRLFDKPVDGFKSADERQAAVSSMSIKTPSEPLEANKYDRGDPRNDPIYEEFARKLDAKINEYMDAGKDTEHLYGTPQEDGTVQYTAERVQQQMQLMDAYVAQYDDIPKDRKAWLIGGVSGSGKSTFLRKQGAELGLQMGERLNPLTGKKEILPLNAAVVNPDDVKEWMQKQGMIPEYPGLSEGETASLIHEESSTISKAIQSRLLKQGTNVVFDLTVSGRSEKFEQKYVHETQSNGYGKITAAFVDGDIATSLYRAGRRHQSPDEQGNATMKGRYVPYDIVASQAPPEGSKYKSTNRETFEKLVEKGVFESSLVYDNMTQQITRR